MATHVITIQNGDHTTGLLKLSDRGHTGADHGDTIIWQRGHSTVLDVTSIRGKDGSPNIWSVPPHRQGNHWTATTSATVPYGTQHNYLIDWVSQNGPRRHDPLISIRPTPFDPHLKVLLVLAAAVAGIFTLKFLGKRRR